MTTATLNSSSAHRFDVRSIPCRVKHGMIFDRWRELAVGDFFVLVNDHDPVPLYYQFAAIFPSAFTWEYEARGPEEFAVRITRLAPDPEQAAVAPPGAPVVPSSSATAGEAGSPAARLIDVRGLEPPAPMHQILDAVAELSAGGKLIAHLDRRPVHLLPELEQRGLQYLDEPQPDGSWRLHISCLRR